MQVLISSCIYESHLKSLAKYKGAGGNPGSKGFHQTLCPSFVCNGCGTYDGQS